MNNTVWNASWAEEVNRYGECAASDIMAVAVAIDQTIRGAGCVPELPVKRLARQILLYVTMRRSGKAAAQLSGPHHTVFIPRGEGEGEDAWDDVAEQVWIEWVNEVFDLTDIFDNVFGVGVEHLWEGGCSGWREEIQTMMPWWIQRDRNIVDTVDGTPLDDEKQVDLLKGTIDPYLLEHGGRMGRRLKGKMESQMND